VRQLEQLVEQLQRENARLREQLAAAQRESSRQAGPFRRDPRLKKPEDQHGKPGRKKGHEGACRAIPAQIDAQQEVPLGGCPSCGGAVGEVRPVVQYIEEIVPARPHVTKVTTYEGVCLCCGQGVRSTHPLQTSIARGAAAVQLGPRALTLAAVLNKHLGLTMRKACEVLRSLCGLRLTAGGLSQALDRVADKVKPLYDGLIDQLRRGDAVHADETSWWVGGPGAWLWVFTDPNATVYHVDPHRGSAVVEQILGAEFAGVLVSDCLNSYDPPPCRKHKCIAHHLRAIKKAYESPGQRDPAYLDDWTGLFKAVIMLYRLRDGLPPGVFEEKRAVLNQQVDDLLARPIDQPGDVAVRHRLAKQRPHLLTCLIEPAAEPTNNRAERDLRPAVIARKLSCGNKTDRGRQTWQILASLTATAHKRAHDAVDFLKPHLQLAGAG
jgi:transposase